MNSLCDELINIQSIEPLPTSDTQMNSFIEASLWFDKLVENGIVKKREPLVARPTNIEHSNFAPIMYNKT